MRYSSNNLNNHHIFGEVFLIVWKEMALAERLFVCLFELFLMFKMPNKLFILKTAF